MKKKSLLIVAILTFVLSFAFAACGETETPHTHEYTAYEWVEGSTPTETEAGKATATCSTCGESTTVDVPKLTDESVWTVTTTDATCTADGEKTYTSKYGTVKVAIAASHKFGDLVAATDSTCLKKGNVAYYHCTVCEKNFAEDGTTELESVEKPLADHDYGTLIAAVASTCKTHGTVAHYHCSVCEKNFDADKNELTSIEAPLADHDYGELVAATESTCQTQGNIAYYHCSVCGKYFNEEKTEITEAETKKPLADHDYGEWQKGDENGHFRVCKTEGCTEKETVAHDYTGQAYYPAGTEEHYVNCKVCRYEHREHHEFGEWTKKDETNHAHKCVKCNKEITEAHTGGTATCKAQAECTVCHEAYGDFAAHVLGEDGVCTVCGKIPNAVFGKTYSAFTVNASGIADTSVNALLTFDANGKAEGVTGSISIIKKNGEFEEESWDDIEYYKITDSSVYIRYVDKEKGTIQFVSSYMKATKSSAYGKYGTPKLTEKAYDGYITATNGFIFIPQGYGSSIVLVPTDTAVTSDKIEASAFNTKGDLYGVIFFKYTGTDAHSVFYNAKTTAVYLDATITDFDGAEVAPAAIKTAPAMIVKDKAGNVIAKYGYDGTSVIALDEWAGKYTGNLGNVTVWGNGKITTGFGDGTYVAVVADDHNIEVTYYNTDGDVTAYYEVMANKADYTYTGEMPLITISYNLGAYGESYEDDGYKKVTFTLPATPVSNNELYMFGGWAIGDATYEAGAKVSADSDVTVTAIWKQKVQITIVDEKNAGGNNGKVFYAGSEDGIIEVLNKNVTTVLEGEEFKYYAIDGQEVEAAGTVGEENLTVTVVWKEKYTLTIVYGNGLENGTETYFEGAATSPKEPPYTAGKAFDHWYTSDDNGATETADYAAGTAITGNTTIYAAWVEANILYGSYTGFEVYGRSYSSPYLSTGKSVEIDVNGKAISGSRIKDNTVADYNNGFFKFGNYYGYYDEASKILVYNDSTGTAAQYDVHILFKGATSAVTEKAKYFIITDGGTQKLIDVTVTVDGVESTFTIYFHDKKVEKVTWTADEGMTGVSDLFSLSTNSWTPSSIKANVLKIYDLDGNLIGDFMKSGSQMVELDGSQGTYTLDGGEDLVLTGTGVATIGTDEGTVTKAADGSAYNYDLYITQGGVNVYYELTIDKEAKTYSLNKPMVTLSFDLDGKGTIAPVSVNKNIEFNLSTDEYKPTYEGYNFKGWYTSKTVGEDGTVTWGISVNRVTLAADTTVYAKWAQVFNVTFETEYGDAPESMVIENEEWVGKYYLTTLSDTDDYAFYGWYLKGDETKKIITSSVQVKSDITFVALWKAKVTLTVKYENGIADKTEKVAPEKPFTVSKYNPTAAELGDYVFRYFYLEGDESKTKITSVKPDVGENVTIVAKMEHTVTLTVKYDGNHAEDVTIVIGPNDTIDFTEAKAKTYTDADGQLWVVDKFYSDAELTTEFTGTSIAADTTIYVGWVEGFAGAGTYYGTNICKTSGSESKTASSSTKFVVDYFKKVVGKGNGVLTDGDTKYNGRQCGIDNGVAFEDYYTNKTTIQYDVNIYFIVKANNVTPGAIVGSVWDDGNVKLLTCTYSDKSTVNAFYYGGRIYGNVTFAAKDASGNAVTDVSKVNDANTVYVLNAEGDLIVGLSKQDGAFAVDPTVVPEA